MGALKSNRFYFALTVVLIAINYEALSLANKEEIIILGSRIPRLHKDTPAAVRVVRRSEMESSGDRHVGDALGRLAGISTYQDLRGQAVMIQGLTSYHVLILIDGERLTGSLGGSIDLSQIPTSQIERIEVLTGASSVLYGSDALGGVINIITRRFSGLWQGTVEGSRDSLGEKQTNMVLGGGTKTLQGGLALHAKTAPGYDLDRSNVDTTVSALDQVRASGMINTQITPSFDLGLRMTSQWQETLGISSTGGGAVIDRHNAITSHSLSMEPKYQASDESLWAAKLSRSTTQDRFDEDQRRAGDLDRNEHSFEKLEEWSLIHGRMLQPQHRLTLGADGLNQSFNSPRLVSGEGSRHRAGGFTQYEWQTPFSVPFYIVPGFRLDRDTQFGQQPSRKLSLRLDPDPSLVLRFSYGEGYRAPSFKELLLDFDNPSVGYRVHGNPDLGSETAKNYSLNLAWQPSPSLWMSGTLFQNDIRNLISTEGSRQDTSRSVVYSYTNRDRIQIAGIGSTIRYQPHKSLGLGFEYSFLRPKDLSQNRILENRPTHSGSAELKYQLIKQDFDLVVQGAFKNKKHIYLMSDGAEETHMEPIERVLNARIHKIWTKHWGSFIGGRNLTNDQGSHINPLAPRSYICGIKATF